MKRTLIEYALGEAFPRAPKESGNLQRICPPSLGFEVSRFFGGAGVEILLGRTEILWGSGEASPRVYSINVRSIPYGLNGFCHSKSGQIIRSFFSQIDRKPTATVRD